MLGFINSIKDVLLDTIWLWGKLLFAVLVALIAILWRRLFITAEADMNKIENYHRNRHPFLLPISKRLQQDVMDHAKRHVESLNNRFIFSAVIIGIIAISSMVSSFLVPYLMKR